MRGNRTQVARVSLRASSRDALSGVVPTIEDALRTASWPTQAGLGGAVLLIRRLDLGVLGRRPSRQAVSALIAARLSEIPFVWAAYDGDGHDSPVMAWPSRAASLAHAVITATRLGPSGASLPWWVARVLGDATVQPSVVVPQIVALIDQASNDGAPVALTEVLDILIANAAADQATEIMLQVYEKAPDFPDVLAKTVKALSVKTKQQVLGQAQPLVARQLRQNMLFAMVENLPPNVRQTWKSLAATPKIKALGMDTHIAIVWSLGMRAIPQASHAAYARRIATQLEKGNSRAARQQAKWPPQQRAPRLIPQHTETPTPTRRVLDPTPQPTSPPASVWAIDNTASSIPGDMQQTMAGGVVGLINLITAMGIPAADKVAGTDLALSLIHRFLMRLPDTEDLRTALPTPMAADDAMLHWACPDNLLQTTPQPMRHRRKGVQFGDQDGKPQVTAALQDGVMILLSRQVRLLTGHGWRWLLTRPALFTATQTHLDVIVSLDDVRLDERRWGLDLSPAWVPWLGRVVTLHFDRFDDPLDQNRGMS